MPTDTGGAPSSRLKGSLGAGGLLLTALAFNAPLAAMGSYVPVGIGLGLGAATPFVYMLLGALVLVFAVGVLAMARHMSKPGAFYTYITAGLGRVVGLGAGFVAVAGYVLLGAGSYVMTGIITQQMVQQLHGPDVPWWFGGLVVWSVVSALTLLNIDISTRVLGVFLCIEVAIVFFWEARVLIDGGPQGRGLNIMAQLHTGSAGVALLFGIACLVGFESLQIFRAETHDPDRTIPKASYLTAAWLAGFYALGSWAYLVAFGTDAAVASASSPMTSFLGSLARYLNAVIAGTANAMIITSAIATLLATQNIAARYLFALGRDGVMPSWLGRVHRRHHAPTRAAAATAVVVFVLTAPVVILRLDPIVSFVALTGLAFWSLISLEFVTALAVVVFFQRHRNAESSVWKSLLAPILASVGLGYVVLQGTRNIDVMIGGSSTLATGCLLLVVAIAAGGMLYANWLRRNRPQKWSRIGDQG